VAAALAAGIAVGALALNSGDDSPSTSAQGTPTPTATATAVASAGAKVVAELEVGERPNVLGVTASKVFVGSFREQRMALVKSNKVRPRGPNIGVGASNIDASNSSVWVVVSRQRKLYRLDPKSGRRIGRAITLPQQPTAVTTTSRSIWVGMITAVPGGPDALAQVDRKTGEITHQFQIEQGISRLASGDGAIWIASRRRALLMRFDPRSQAVTDNIRIGSDQPFDVTYGGGAVWVTSPRDDIVSRVDPKTHDVTRIGVGRGPQGIAVRGNDVFVANSNDNTVTRIDGRSSRVVGSPIQVPNNPYAVAISGRSVWVTCQPVNRVVRIDYEPLTDRGG
jgi:DNA-binding beta-propeller fold protein YncE